MTNEELVTLIQHGESERLAELWAQVCRFVRQQAIRRVRQLEGRGGVTAEDLYQSGYIALVGAVQTYRADGGKTFLSWLDFYLRREFARAAGCLTERQRRDPLGSADSLDRPLDAENAGADALAELVPDPFDHAEALAEADERAWRRNAIRAAVDKLPAQQRRGSPLFRRRLRRL